MTKEHMQRFRQVYGILLSIVIIIAGICLIFACIDIYRSGEHPYSREAVAEHFAPISVPVYLCLAMVIGGFLLSWLLPPDGKKSVPGKQDRLILQRLREKADLEACDPSLRGAIAVQQKRRGSCRILCGAGMLLCAVVFLAYALNGSHFSLPDINGSMIRAMWVLLPCLAVAFACAVFSVFYCRASIRKEIALLRQAPARKAPGNGPKSRHNWQASVRCAIAAVGIVLLLFGFFTGGTADVLTKSINICTECVGLG